LFSHRGFFHSIFPIAIILGISMYAEALKIGTPIAIGYASHLFSDCVTRQGCNLLHPVSKFKIQGFMITGGLTELITLLIFIVADIFFSLTYMGLI